MWFRPSSVRSRYWGDMTNSCQLSTAPLARPGRSSRSALVGPGDRVIKARSRLVRSLGPFAGIAQPHREIHTHWQQHLPDRVVKADEGLRQLQGDEAVDEAPQLSSDTLRFLFVDSA